MESPQATTRKGGLMGRSMSLKFGGEDNSAKTAAGKQILRRNSLVRNSMNASKYAAALDAFKNLDDEEEDSWEDRRVRMKKMWTSSVYFQYYENLLILVGLLAAVEFIHESYYTDTHNIHYGQKPYLEKIAAVFTGFFAFNWVLELILADRTSQYLIR
jgi:hypothetical protein